MYKFLMVDDEDIIRTGFQQRIDWAGLGFEFLPPCTDGREAVSRIDELKPHVVMTDICMPFLDGIGLSAWIARNHPDILVLVLSGYDDFEYARASIRNRVYDYILKPITARDLRELLARVRAKLDEEQGQGQQLHEERERSKDMQREDCLRRLVRSEMAETDGGILAALFGEDAAGHHHVVVRLDVEAASGADDGYAREQARARLAAAVQGVVSPLGTGGNRCCVSLVESFAGLPPRSATTLVFHDPSAERVVKLADYLAGSIRDTLERSGFRAGAGVGGVHCGFAGVGLGAREAALAAEYRVIRGWGLFHYQPSRETATVAALEIDRLTERFRTLIRTGSSGELDVLAVDIRTRLTGTGAGIRRIRQDVQTLFTVLADLLADNIAESEAADHETIDFYYHITDHLMGLDDLEHHLRELCSLAIDTVRQKGASSSEKKVLEFKDYIAAHFAEQDLSITKVAGELIVSPSYLSKILKRHLDRSFVEYLTDWRLERAKEFLVGSDLMTYEIAEATGYPDARYFSSIFKKLTGTTPSEYRANRRKRD